MQKTMFKILPQPVFYSDAPAVASTGLERARSGLAESHCGAGNAQVTSVDKTWTFVKDDAGLLRIVVHHSSLEYAGQ